MDIANVVAAIRLHYHANMTSVVNVLNQLHVMPDEKAEEANRRHMMTVVNDILPRLGYDTSAFHEEENDEELDEDESPEMGM